MDLGPGEGAGLNVALSSGDGAAPNAGGDRVARGGRVGERKRLLARRAGRTASAAGCEPQVKAHLYVFTHRQGDRRRDGRDGLAGGLGDVAKGRLAADGAVGGRAWVGARAGRAGEVRRGAGGG